MKKILSIIMLISILIQPIAFADSGAISVKIDGVAIPFDQPPIMISDRVLVPLRAIFEALNAHVEWNEQNYSITSTKDDTTVIMYIDNNEYYINGQKKYMDVPPTLINARTLIPVRAVAESFGCNVDWDSNSQTVIITSEYNVTTTKVDVVEENTNMKISYSYPQISCDNKSINTDLINIKIKEDIINEISKAKNDIIELGANSCVINYDITNKTNNLYSILYTSSVFVEEDSRPLISRFSKVYRLDNGRPALLTDYFSSLTEEEIIGNIITAFNQIILQEPDLYYEDSAELVEIHFEDLVIYPCGSEIAVSFNPGVIAPYELGFQTIAYPAEY
ncbi:MAG: stalk domain-containing protein [Eubacteriales bacterium]|nr:stalk domain-containing protein [Eubacteriales bacterium]